MSYSARLMRGAASALLLVATAARAPADPATPMLGDIHVLTQIPAPGFPEGIAVKGHKVYVATQSRSATAGLGPSKVFAFDARTGQLLREYAIENEDLSQDHSLNNLAFGRGNRLYVLSPPLGIIRLDVRSGAQTIYADPLPDLPPCSQVAPGTACSPTSADSPPLPNDIVFDRAGNAYVTDSAQATIFRVPPGGGQPQIWFQDARLDGVVGANGIRLSPDRQRLVFAVSFTLQATGPIYSLPLVPAPQPTDLALFHQYATEGPDQLAFGRSGNLYVTLAVANQVSVLDGSGNELTRYSGPASNGVPIDSPSGVAFRRRSLLVNNHALFSQTTANMAVLEIFVGDRGRRLAHPRLP